MIHVVFGVLIWLLVLLPGVLLVARLAPFLSPAGRLFVGGASSCAALIVLAWVESKFLGLALATPYVWLALLLVSLWVGRGLKTARNCLAAVRTSREAQGLAALVGTSFVVRLIPLPWSFLPPGYDPTNHLLLAKLIQVKGRIPSDWLPFEPLAVNYPTGLHNVLAWLATISTLDLTVLWRGLFPVFGTLLVVGVYGFARRLSTTHTSALWAGFAYSLLVYMGSLHYYGWGGLVNLTGLCLAVAVLLVALEASPERGTKAAIGLGALLWSATCLTHHHVMLSGCIMLLTVAAAAWWAHRAEGLHLRLLAALALAALMSAFHLVPYGWKVLRIGETASLTWLEAFYGPTLIVQSMGVIFPVAGLYGLTLLVRQRASYPHLVALMAFLGFFLMFVGIEYVYQGVHYLLTERRTGPLVPSRFLTNSVVFLAIPVGMALERIHAALRQRSRRVAILVLLGLSAQPIYHVAQLCRLRTPAHEVRALVYLRDHTPADAFVVNDLHEHALWVNFFCWRETTLTPLSGSEPLRGREHRYAKYQEAVRAGRPIYLIGVRPELTPLLPNKTMSVYRVQ